MDKHTSQILIETVVRKTLRDMKDAPERSTRNLVDMARQFSEGAFQTRFFSALQEKLQDERSAYYGLVRDVVEHVDTERLVTFSMDLGYHSCILGAETIRRKEKKLHCHIPWTLLLQVDGETCAARREAYREVVREGAELGIFSWILFAGANPAGLLPLIGEFPDHAFFLCCAPRDITDEFLDTLSALRNLMVVVRLENGAEAACELLRAARQLYSVYYPYSEADVPAVQSGDLFSEMEQLHPVFGILIARRDCPKAVRQQTAELVASARSAQAYQVMLWELDSDNRIVERVISEVDCAVWFDRDGVPRRYETALPGDLFADSLKEIFQRAFSRQQT